MEREKEAFIEWLYTQYAVKLERASLNWVQHRPEYRDMAVSYTHLTLPTT